MADLNELIALIEENIPDNPLPPEPGDDEKIEPEDFREVLIAIATEAVEGGGGGSDNNYTNDDKAKVDNLPDNTIAVLQSLSEGLESLGGEIADKVSKVEGYGLSENNYSDEDKQKVADVVPLPSQTGQAGKVLGTDGTSLLWKPMDSGAVTVEAVAAMFADNGIVTFSVVDGKIVPSFNWDGSFTNPDLLTEDDQVMTRAQITELIAESGGTPAFTPLSFGARLNGWYDASHVTNTGTTVNSLVDRGPKGNNLISVSGKEPILSSTGGRNNKAFITADGTKAMQCAAFSFTNTPDLNIFMVIKSTDSASVTIPIELSANVNDNAGAFYIVANADGGSTMQVSHLQSGDLAYGSANVVVGDWIDLRTANYRELTANEARIFINGTEGVSNAVDVSSGNFIGGQSLNLFARDGGASLLAKMQLMALIVVSGVLTNEELSNLQDYITANY